ncbi:MAG: peptidoglycan-binding domain-containing protein [Acidimicrobiia bacterium]
MPRQHRRIPALVGLLLIVASCSDDSANTTSTTVTTTAITTTSSTTTTTRPLAPSGPPIASEGDTNEVVFAIQFLMNCAGYGPLEVDGVFGPATAAAIEEMQADLDREVTGEPDEFTLALLSRSCADSRRLEVGGNAVRAVGNVSVADPDTYFVEAEEGDRLAVLVESTTGEARIQVRGPDGNPVGPSTVAAWALDLTVSQDHVITVSTIGDATSYTLTAAVLDPPDGDAVPAADPDTVAVDDLEEAVTRVCLDSTGDGSYVAETGSGYLIVATGAPGSFAVSRGGIGASAEFVYRDESPGYAGFPVDLEIEVGDRIVGTAAVYPEGGSEPVDLAFNLTRSAAPCEGGAGIPVVLEASGLGIVEFGALADDALALVRQALPQASPPDDTGWVEIDPVANDFGVCEASVTEVRAVTIDNLTLYFTDGTTSGLPAGTRRFVGYRATAGVFPFATEAGVGPGSTIGDVLAAHPDAGIGVGLEGGRDVFITSPPGNDAWLRALAPDAADAADVGAEITAIVGGRFCDL